MKRAFRGLRCQVLIKSVFIKYILTIIKLLKIMLRIHCFIYFL